MKTYTYRVIIEPDERDTFHAFVPALAGCHTWGDSFEEARRNIRDAIDVYLRSMIADGEKIREDVGVEIVETIPIPAGSRRSLVHA